MNFTSNLMLNINSILVLVTIYIHASRHKEESFLQTKLYMLMLQITILLLLLDILSRFDGNPDTLYTEINFIGNFLIFLLSPIVPSLWLLYSHYQVYHDVNKTKRWVIPLGGIITVNAIITVASQFYGWVYFIDQENIYHRGPLFWVPASLTIGLIFTAFCLIVLNREKIENKHYLSLVFFAVPPFVCILLQIIIYGTSLILNGLSLSLLIVFFTIQNRRLDTDYLTGVYNRKSLETYMKKKIDASTENHSFSAILIDLNDFKMINDTFGHDKGDEALETSVMLLKSCLRANDFIARYGGDEFYLILDVSNRIDLENTVSRIYSCLERYNANPAKSFPLGFSMGYEVYDYQSHLKVEEFQKQIDILMYENKRANKANCN